MNWKEGKLPFLDLLITRSEGELNFSIYRKPTSTTVYIPVDSCHNIQHKSSAFISMVYRLLLVPLNEEDYNTEYNVIKSIAKENGFKPDIIDKMIKKTKGRIELNNSTTLKKDKTVFSSIIPINFHPAVNSELKNAYKSMDIMLVNKNSSKLRYLLNSTKDRIPKLQLSGIYQISCQDCPKKYIGQTARSLLVRSKEHQSHTKLGHETKSAVAKHMIEEKHNIDPNGIVLLKSVENWRELNAFESAFINSNDNLMNLEDPPINSVLFETFKIK